MGKGTVQGSVSFFFFLPEMRSVEENPAEDILHPAQEGYLKE